MTEHDDDHDDGGGSLRAFADLDAWAPPPPPPAGVLADAVVAQVRSPARAAARDLDERPPRRRPLAIAAAVAAGVAMAAAGVLAIVHRGAEREREPEPEAARGELFAARASHVNLGSSAAASASSAELDPGAEIRWQRDGRRLTASQPRGAALWRVAGDDTLVIDAGAAVASVEASGASLRVEVQMNRSDMRVIGASAATALTVALVTVVVYQGHAKVASAGQTVTVEAGGAVEVRPQQPARDAITVGAAAPGLEKMQQEVRELRARLDAAERVLAESKPGGCDEASCAQTGYAGDCCEVYRPAAVAPDRPAARVQRPPSTPPAPAPAPEPKACDASELADRGREAFGRGSYAEALQHYEAAIACSPQSHLQQKAFVVACNLRDIAKAAAFYARMPQALRMQAINVCLRNGISEEDLEAAAAAVKLGKLVITTSPPARVIVDGKEVGTSPLTIEVAPGRHRVTFAVGADRYTFTTTTRAGETVTLHKALGNP